jgi:hypothetical protein
LLSKAALPRVELPQFEPALHHEFRMPADVTPNAEGSGPHRHAGAGFRARTLAWFAIGDLAEQQEAIADGELGDEYRAPAGGWRVAAALAGLLLAAAGVAWAVRGMVPPFWTGAWP